MCIKIFWVPVVLIAFFAFAYQFVVTTKVYHKQDVATSFQVQPNNSLRIPDLLVCVNSRFYSKYIHEHDLDQELVEWFASASFALGNMRYLYNNRAQYHSNPEILRDHSENATKFDLMLQDKGWSFYDFILKTGFKCDDLIHYCAIGGFTTYDCCKTAKPMITGYGLCQLLQGIDQRIGGSAKNMGLEIYFELPSDRFGSTSLGNPWADGVTVRFVNPITEEIEPSVINLPVSHQTTVELENLEYVFLQRRVFTCNTTMLHAEQTCKFQCIFRDVLETCGCASPDLYDFFIFQFTGQHEFRLCSPSESINCIHKKLMREPDSYYRNVSKVCTKACLPRCVRTLWRKSYSTTQLSVEMAALHMDAKKLERWKYDTAVFSLFYPKMEVTRIKQQFVMTFESLIGIVGGQLGYWVGASLLSVIHVVLLMIFYYRRKRKLRKEREAEEKEGSGADQHGEGDKISDTDSSDSGEKSKEETIGRKSIYDISGNVDKENNQERKRRSTEHYIPTIG